MMKTITPKLRGTFWIVICLALSGPATHAARVRTSSESNAGTNAEAAGPEKEKQIAGTGKDQAQSDKSPDRTRRERIVVTAIEPGSDTLAGARKQVPWLGISTEESTEALSAQLGLGNGVGLVVSYVAPDGPAAKAGLQKNDVLVKFEDQDLVHPAQLRKLVRARKIDEKVSLTYIRAGKKENVSVTLGQTEAGFGFSSEDNLFEGDLHRQLRELRLGDKLHDHLGILKDSMAGMKIDSAKLRAEIERSLEAAGKTVEDALKQSTNLGRVLEPLGDALRELEKSRVTVNNNATVTVRSGGKSARSIVKSDDAGTIVIVCNPKPHLTAHDATGKLLFDGKIDSKADREKVPADLWKKVEPLLDENDLVLEDKEQ
jgi:hypothetical protein